jgi:serine/threonine protein phosphatase PrpC
MKYAEIGASKIIYVEPGDDFLSVAGVVAGPGQPVVLILPECGGALRGPADFLALKQVKRARDADVRLVMAHRPALQTLARRCGFPVFPSLESIDAGSERQAGFPKALPPLQMQREGRRSGVAGETEPYTLQALRLPERRTTAPSPPDALVLRLLAGHASHAGVRRAHAPNEDCVYSLLSQRVAPTGSAPQQFGLFVVSDGMGGHEHGQEAGRLAVGALTEWVLPRLQAWDVGDGEALLAAGVQQANRAICRINGERQTDMGAALTAALVIGVTVFVANVGDCRTYLCRPGAGLYQITDDHSPQAELGRAGLLDPMPLSTRKQGHEITHRLGGDPALSVDSFALACLPGDVLLLCSDGLWRVVGHAVLERVLRAYAMRPGVSCRTLVEAALEAGGPDNISALAVSIQQQSRRSPTSSGHLPPLACSPGSP